MLLMILCLSLTLTACGGESAPAGEQETIAEAEDATVQEGLPMSEYEDPQYLSGAILDNYYGAFSELATLVSMNPSATELKPLVEELRNSYIDIFVGFGAYYEAMDSSARATVDACVAAGFAGLNMDDFNAVSDAVAFYRAEDGELADMMADFNIITQYAFYDLLRQQDPEEAARLGL
jgi:hypothetical protein